MKNILLSIVIMNCCIAMKAQTHGFVSYYQCSFCVENELTDVKNLAFPRIVFKPCNIYKGEIFNKKLIKTVFLIFLGNQKAIYYTDLNKFSNFNYKLKNPESEPQNNSYKIFDKLITETRNTTIDIDTKNNENILFGNVEPNDDPNIKSQYKIFFNKGQSDSFKIILDQSHYEFKDKLIYNNDFNFMSILYSPDAGVLRNNGDFKFHFNNVFDTSSQFKFLNIDGNQYGSKYSFQSKTRPITYFYLLLSNIVELKLTNEIRESATNSNSIITINFDHNYLPYIKNFGPSVFASFLMELTIHENDSTNNKDIIFLKIFTEEFIKFYENYYTQYQNIDFENFKDSIIKYFFIHPYDSYHHNLPKEIKRMKSNNKEESLKKKIDIFNNHHILKLIENNLKYKVNTEFVKGVLDDIIPVELQDSVYGELLYKLKDENFSFDSVLVRVINKCEKERGSYFENTLKPAIRNLRFLLLVDSLEQKDKKHLIPGLDKIKLLNESLQIYLFYPSYKILINSSFKNHSPTEWNILNDFYNNEYYDLLQNIDSNTDSIKDEFNNYNKNLTDQKYLSYNLIESLKKFNGYKADSDSLDILYKAYKEYIIITFKEKLKEEFKIYGRKLEEEDLSKIETKLRSILDQKMKKKSEIWNPKFKIQSNDYDDILKVLNQFKSKMDENKNKDIARNRIINEFVDKYSNYIDRAFFPYFFSQHFINNLGSNHK